MCGGDFIGPLVVGDRLSTARCGCQGNSKTESAMPWRVRSPMIRVFTVSNSVAPEVIAAKV